MRRALLALSLLFPPALAAAQPVFLDPNRASCAVWAVYKGQPDMLEPAVRIYLDGVIEGAALAALAPRSQAASILDGVLDACWNDRQLSLKSAVSVALRQRSAAPVAP